MTAPSPRRSGVSLVELVVALTLFSILLATTLAFYDQQGEAFTEGNTRMTVMQNLRYGVNSIEQNLRTAGVGVPVEQPVMVYAGDRVLAFNADYASNIEDDFFAVYHDTRLPDGAVSALSADRRITLPHTPVGYPDTTYRVGSGNSPAETLIFFFEPDSATVRADDWVLYRQTNDLPPEPVARRLLKTDRPFFTYYRLDDSDGGDPIRAVPAVDLPQAHAAAVHGSPEDTGAVAVVDSIRAVRVTYAATSGTPGVTEAVRQITRLIRIPNAGLTPQRTCGNRPLLGTPLLAAGIPPGGARGHVRLEWTRATDEVTGEQDVLRYVVWRRPGSGIGWGDPMASVPAGAATYLYQDFTAEDGVEYEYALAAQDCTPQYSALATAGPVGWSSE